MLFSWIKQRRRRKILAEPFPNGWLTILRRNVPYYELLTETEQAKLRDDTRVFIAEKYWEGCGGLKMTDEIKVTVAAQACLLLLGIEHDYYPMLQSILVYPSGYEAPDRTVIKGGIVIEGRSARLGEAWYRGPVVLSWDTASHDGRHMGDGKNVVFHEFAHQLDMLDRSIDGTPPLRSREQYQRWREVMSAEFQRLVEASDRGEATLFDQYGATDPAEFFAVATECYFERPIDMLKRHPRMYEVMREYYGQDTAARVRNRRQGDKM
jgi:Mlc titration factor MtfA (ptsG expression regulator)